VTIGDMRWVLLAALLAGCGFDGDDVPQDEQQCLNAGGKLVARDGWLVCDGPATGGYVVHTLAQARPGDAGTQD
jgi:hypothetical protein